MAGSFGSDSWPTALMRRSTVSVEPSANVTVQVLVSASHAAAVTSRPNATRSETPNRSATPRR
jgi:hypothetical protein